MYKGKGKITSIADKQVKALLHICALNAIRFDEDLRIYYQRKTLQEGKPKMAALNAVRNKLRHRIYACVTQQRIYAMDYQRSEEGTASALATA